jgi:F-type H+-transporting ATPase subunit b
MNNFVLMLQAGGGSQAQEIARTFGVDWPHLTAQVISFTIVCILLYLLAYKPVLTILDERRRQIAQGLANTAKINAALAAIDGQRQSVLAAAQVEAARIIAEGRNVATQLKEQETQRAAASATLIVLNAREAAMQEHVRMIDELRREVGQLVVKTTAAVTGKILTADDQVRLSEETAKQLAASS